MVSGRRCAVAVCFALLALGCSTEDKGLGQYDALNAPENLQSDADLPAPSLDAGVVRSDGPVTLKPDAAADAPVAPTDAAADAPANNRPLGGACGKDSECSSGHCHDGGCCDTACNDGCSACTAARTGRPDGTCAVAADREGQVCGKGCGVVQNVPAVVARVCVGGQCVVPTTAPMLVESCQDADPCTAAFCDDATARCVTSICPQAGTCCCQNNGGRSCVKQEQCKGGARMCVQ